MTDELIENGAGFLPNENGNNTIKVELNDQLPSITECVSFDPIYPDKRSFSELSEESKTAYLKQTQTGLQLLNIDINQVNNIQEIFTIATAIVHNGTHGQDATVATKIIQESPPPYFNIEDKKYTKCVNFNLDVKNVFHTIIENYFKEDLYGKFQLVSITADGSTDILSWTGFQDVNDLNASHSQLLLITNLDGIYRFNIVDPYHSQMPRVPNSQIESYSYPHRVKMENRVFSILIDILNSTDISFVSRFLPIISNDIHFDNYPYKDRFKMFLDTKLGNINKRLISNLSDLEKAQETKKKAIRWNSDNDTIDRTEGIISIYSTTITNLRVISQYILKLKESIN